MSAPEPIDDLARRAGAGDADALEHFIRSTQASVWRFVAHLADPGIADDLTQETYLRAVGAIGRFRGDSRATTWLLAIARRVVYDELRRSYRRPRTTELHPDVDAGDGVVPPAVIETSDAMVEIGLLLDGLDTDRREALVLTQILGYSYAEAAEICSVPVGTIRSRVARGRADLIELGD